jgi:hypothetical protein
MTVIDTRQDLVNWVSGHAGDNLSDEDHDTIADAILDGDHPPYGTAWDEFLKELPEYLTDYLPTKKAEDLLEKEFEEQLALYPEDDTDRERFAAHNILANLMHIAVDNGVDLIDLIVEGVDLYEQRGEKLPGAGPKAFFARCRATAIR